MDEDEEFEEVTTEVTIGGPSLVKLDRFWINPYEVVMLTPLPVGDVLWTSITIRGVSASIDVELEPDMVAELIMGDGS